jgi:N-hydroxyarylamine O-acetyltransferase
MDAAAMQAYLERIGVVRPETLDRTALRTLHRAHLTAVPFENLSQHLGEPVSLTESDLIDKIVTRRRGGFCYELNGAFALLLQALGAKVVLVSAWVQGADGFGPPFDHLALLVETPDGSGPWLVDVGFGSHSVYPLLLSSRLDQDDPGGRFTLVDVEADLDVYQDGERQYRIEHRERALSDFGPTCWWQQTSPQSHFTWSTICSRLTDGDGNGTVTFGRVSLSGRTLISTVNGIRTEQKLPTDDAVLAAYREHFGIVLDQVPEVKDARAG